MSDTTPFVSTEISRDVTVEDSQMAAEATILGVHSDLQGYQTPSSDALKHSPNTQPAAVIYDDEEISEVCQDRSTAVSTQKFLPSEDQQLPDPAVKLPEKEQMVTVAFQDKFTDKTLFPEQTNDNLQQPVNVQSSVGFPQLASFKKQDLSDGLQNDGATLHPEVVHFRRGQSPGDVTESQPFVKDGWTKTDNSEPTKQSVKPTIGQKKSLKENLPAVVKLNRLPIQISTVKSIVVSRPPQKISDRDFSIPASLPLNMSKDHLCNDENSSVCTKKVTVDFMSKNPPTPPAAVAFKKNEFSAGKKTTSKPEAGKNNDLSQDCALPVGSEDETRSTTLKPNSKSSKDPGEGLPLTSKDQFPAQIAASAVPKVPEEVRSAHIFFLLFLVILSSYFGQLIPSFNLSFFFLDSCLQASSATVHSTASSSEAGKSVKTEPKAVLALLQSRMKRHIQAKRTKLLPQSETQDVNCERLRLACDRSNHQRTLINSEGTQEPTDIVPTKTVSCQTETVGDFSKFKADNKPSSVRHQSLNSSSIGDDSQKLSSSPSTSRQSRKSKLSPSVKRSKKEFVDRRESRATRTSVRTKNSTVPGICSKNAGAFISLKGSKLTQDVSERNFEVVPAKARKVAKSKSCKGLKLPTRVKESPSLAPSSSQAVLTPHDLPPSRKTSPRAKKGAQLSAGEDTKFQKPPDALPAGGTPIARTGPPVASPLDPLSFIGTRLLKNQCGKCGQILTSKAALENHVSRHASDQPLSCSLCGKNFTDSASFKRHSRVHRNGRIHVCQQCGKGFVYRFCLTKHINMVHNHIRPFVCHICNKGCFTKLDVEAHIRMHTGEKPFHCHICDKKFNRRVNLNIHLRRHNGEKRHWCPFCGKGFLDYNHLKRHKYIHTGEKPHSCPHCPKSFTQSGHLKKHLKTVHKGK